MSKSLNIQRVRLCFFSRSRMGGSTIEAANRDGLVVARQIVKEREASEKSLPVTVTAKGREGSSVLTGREEERRQKSSECLRSSSDREGRSKNGN